MTTVIADTQGSKAKRVLTMALGFVALVAWAMFYAGILRNSAVNIIYQVASGGEGRPYQYALAQAESARNELGQNALHVAVAFKREAMLGDLLKEGADLNAQDNTGLTPLHVAAMYGRAICAEWLLDHGATIDLRDKYGDTPLHTAAVFGRGNVYQLLLDRGARDDEKNNDGRTPYALAKHYGQEKLLAYLDAQAPTAATPGTP